MAGFAVVDPYTGARGREVPYATPAELEAALATVWAGWQRVGEIPDFALLAHGELGPTTVFYKRLDVDERTPPVRELRVAVTADDYEHALAFYRDTLGLPERAAFSSEDGRVTILEAGRATLELLDPPHAAFVDEVEVGRRVAGHIRLALEVDDSATLTRSLEDAGMWVSEAPVVPIDRLVLAGLDGELTRRGVELRVVDSLAPLAPLWQSSLHVSGIRLRNAATWNPS